MPFNIREAGENAADKLAVQVAEMGRVPRIDLVDPETNQAVNIREMIGTDDGAEEFVEKITYDLAAGRETVPLIYKEIYRTLTDPNFPRKITAKEFGQIQVVFLKKLEGGEVKFGALGPGQEKSVTFETWAAGIEYDEDIVEYNETWRVTEIGEAFGESYNKLLNHLHLNPIITGSYTTTGGGLAAQAAAQKAGTAQEIAFDTDIETTLLNAVQVLPQGSVILCNSFDVPKLEEAIAASMLKDNSANVVKRKFSSASLIPYDGETITVGEKEYAYGGVTAGYIYVIVPKRNFVEYIKHDLRVDSDDGDLSRLILTQVVGRARRAVVAGIGGAEGAVKVKITS